MLTRTGVIALVWCLIADAAGAGEANVETVRITRERAGTYRLDVAIRHGDTGWKHYADKWDVVAPGGEILATRVLLHPHENEQPFTRSLTGVSIPGGIARVTIRAHDKIHGYGGKVIPVAVPGDGGGS